MSTTGTLLHQTKQKLKDSGYIWKGGSGSGYWCRTFAPDNFSLDRLRRQPWIARGVTIQIHDATDGRPLRRLESAVRELLATTKPTSSG